LVALEGVASSMQRDRTISSRLLHVVGVFAAANGLNFDDLARDSGIDPAVTHLPDGEFRFADFLNLLEVAAQRSGSDDFGLRLAQTLPLRLTGIYHYLTTNAATLRAEAVAASKYVGLITNAYTAQFDDSSGMGWVTFAFQHDTGCRKQFVDLQVAAVVLRVRQVMEDASLPIRIELERPKPRASDSFARILGTDVHFNSPVNRIGFLPRDLVRPIPGADPHLFAELERVGDLLLKLKYREDSLVESISAFVVRSLPKGDATPEHASRTLNITERTLQRNLAAANTTFSKIVDETRQRMAYHFLGDTDMPMTEAAYLLDFSELSAFSRAARVWFGESPSAFRKRMRAPSSETAQSVRQPQLPN
jgi:AraC-like DNA-binding protein